MSFKKVWFVFKKNEHEAEWKKKIASLEVELNDLKKTIAHMEKENNNESEHRPKESPIIIEKINIEKIILDKYELNNNFGQLGIKELTGKLNIGATYGSDFTPTMDEETETGSTLSGERLRREQKQDGPRVNIKSKHED